MNPNCKLDIESLRSQVIGADAAVETPFGDRLMVYADYTASGRCLVLAETYLQNLQRIYANTHTEDDISGRSMTQLLVQAEESIKKSVNAGPDGLIIAVGSGATGAIDKLQQIIGVALPPATRQSLTRMMEDSLGDEAHAKFNDYLEQHQPVVFVGPYEHHSNEISWRENLATVIEVPMDSEGGIDMQYLETQLQNPAYEGRKRIGSFSAASNVTGMRTPVHQIASLLHKYDAIACFDFAASAPYVEIDMDPPPGKYEGDASLDAVFISPHKFIGGPGSMGILVFKEHIYHKELPPSVSAGGTVDYVGPTSQDFIRDIEEREKAGTPGVLQILKAALAFQIKDHIGVDAIEKREGALVKQAFSRWLDNPHIEIMGNPDPERRIGIISFNIRNHRGKFLHPKFVTSLLNDLFGIQTRAGCSCAGPYGHRLLNIDDETSEQYRKWIVKGLCGIKPGWCRVSMHYAMDDLEAGFIFDAVEFVANHGHLFLSLYNFDIHSGAWTHKSDQVHLEGFSLEAAIDCTGYHKRTLSNQERIYMYSAFLSEAKKMAEQLAEQDSPPEHLLEPELETLKFFSVPESSVVNQ